MSILINENLLRLKFLQETGYEMDLHHLEFVEWLKEKLSIVIQEQEKEEPMSKSDFLKSANQQNEVTHPYDLSREGRTK